MPVQQTISPGYRQLADIFETLETSGLKADQDFGANIVTCFTWYLSPQAVAFLEKSITPLGCLLSTILNSSLNLKSGTV